MKATQILLLVIAGILLFGLGFMMGSSGALDSASMETVTDVMQGEGDEAPETSATAAAGEEVVASISLDMLTDSQRVLLQTLGVSESEIQVTASMQACAEAEIGVARMAAIIAGDTPSFGEGAALISCYKSN